MLIYVCDDEPQILNMISLKISNYMPDSIVEVFKTGENLLDAAYKRPCDILFLDIDMPGLDGMEIAKQISTIQHKPLLVFVTNHDELVYESFQYHPFGFIRKNLFEKEIERILDDCRAEIDFLQKHFCFRMNGQDIVLLLSDILYFEADGNYLKICTVSEWYRFRSTISEMEGRLAKDGFIRLHKGFLVNRAAICLLGKEEVELLNGDKLPIGKNYAGVAKQQILQYMRLLMRE